MYIYIHIYTYIYIYIYIHVHIILGAEDLLPGRGAGPARHLEPREGGQGQGDTSDQFIRGVVKGFQRAADEGPFICQEDPLLSMLGGINTNT